MAASEAQALVARLRSALSIDLAAETAEYWVTREPWHPREEALPLLVGCDPRDWPALLADTARAADAATLAALLQADLGSAASRTGFDAMALRAWADGARISLPPALGMLLDFIARTLPAQVPVVPAAAATATAEQVAVLGAALALVTRFPERHRDAEGQIDAQVLADAIVAQAAVWFAQGAPAMTRETMASLLAEYLYRDAPARRSFTR